LFPGAGAAPAGGAGVGRRAAAGIARGDGADGTTAGPAAGPAGPGGVAAGAGRPAPEAVLGARGVALAGCAGEPASGPADSGGVPDGADGALEAGAGRVAPGGADAPLSPGPGGPEAPSCPLGPDVARPGSLGADVPPCPPSFLTAGDVDAAPPAEPWTWGRRRPRVRSRRTPTDLCGLRPGWRRPAVRGPGPRSR
jgi:hypothetical protein